MRDRRHCWTNKCVNVAAGWRPRERELLLMGTRVVQLDEQACWTEGPARTSERDKRARRVTFEGSSRDSGGSDGGGRYDGTDEAATVGRSRDGGGATVAARMVYGRWRRDGGEDDGAREKAINETGTVDAGTVETGTVDAGTISMRQR
ncbi:hypothetical protein Syun_019839 [Stephania yunnanensis]|uniref:Uncharacterized protein n=1 Tax=Stephania yunnanensis TaxID=152371 RepID=A0AAP0IWT9_9MAGN